MSSSNESVRVSIFGNDYLIISDVDTSTTNEIARYVNSKMTEIHQNSSTRDHMKVAVLSALNIAGELFESKEKCVHQEQTISELQDRIHALTQKVNSVLQH